MTIKTRAALNTQAEDTIQDNTSADITPAEIRQMIKDLVDSARLLEDIIGTVSQSGGVATGAIFEKGNNANGGYVKFANGSMICGHAAIATLNSTQRLRYSWTFPAPFIASDAYTWSAMVQTRNPTNTADNQGMNSVTAGMVIENSHDANLIAIDVYNPAGPFVTGDHVWLSLSAVGRWF